MLHCKTVFNGVVIFFAPMGKVNLQVECHARLTIPSGKVKINERTPVCRN